MLASSSSLVLLNNDNEGLTPSPKASTMLWYDNSNVAGLPGSGSEADPKILSLGTVTQNAAEIAVHLSGITSYWVKVSGTINMNGYYGDGLHITGCNNIIVDGLTVYGGGRHGIHVERAGGSDNIYIRNSIVYNMLDSGIRVEYIDSGSQAVATDVIIENNQIWDVRHGIIYASADGDRGSRINNNRIYTQKYSGGNGIWLRGYSNGVEIYENYIHHFDYGLLVDAIADGNAENYGTNEYSQNFNIHNNHFLDNPWGVVIFNDNYPRGTNYIQSNNFIRNNGNIYTDFSGASGGSLTVSSNYYDHLVYPDSDINGFIDAPFNSVTTSGGVPKTDTSPRSTHLSYTTGWGIDFVTAPQIQNQRSGILTPYTGLSSAITWTASRHYLTGGGFSGSTPSYTLQMSNNSGTNWWTIYTGSATTFNWNSMPYPDGNTYTFRVSATIDAVTKWWTSSTNSYVHNRITPPALTSPGDLAGWWKFDGDKTDSSGRGLTISTSGGSFITGQYGQGYQLNTGTGVNSGETATSFILDTDTHTITFWARFSGTNPYWSYIMAYRPSDTSVPDAWTSDRSPGLWQNPGATQIHWRYGGPNNPNSQGTSGAGPSGEGSSFTTNIWYHIAGVKNGANFKFYVNGIEVVSSTVENPKFKGASTLLLGNATVAIDDLRIYQRALNSTEINNVRTNSVYMTNYGTNRVISWTQATTGAGYTIVYDLAYNQNGGAFTNIITGLSSSITSYPWNTASVNDGDNYRIRVTARCTDDSVQTYSLSEPFRIQNDAVIVLSPSNSTYMNVLAGSDAYIVWTVYDYSYSGIWANWSIKEGNTYRFTTGPRYIANGTQLGWKINTNLYADYDYTYKLEFDDNEKAGNVTSTEVTIHIQNVLPAFTYPSPYPGTKVQNYLVGGTVRWTITDYSLTAGAQYSVLLDGTPITGFANVSLGSFVQNIDAVIPTDTPVGLHQMYIWAFDGYAWGRSDNFAIQINNNNPTFATPTATSDVIEGTDGQYVYFRVYDDGSWTSNRTYWIYQNETIVRTLSWSNNTLIAYPIPWNLAEGYYEYKIRADDGYVGWLDAPNSTKIIIHRMTNPKPNIVNSLPVIQQYGVADGILRWNVTDDTTNTSRAYSIFRNGSRIYTDTWSSGINITYTIPSNTMVGDYGFVLEVTDGYPLPGHNSSSLEVLVRILNNVPEYLYSSNLSKSKVRLENSPDFTIWFKISDDGSNTGPLTYTLNRYNVTTGGVAIVQTGTWTISSLDTDVTYIIPKSTAIGEYLYVLNITDGYGNHTSLPIGVTILAFEPPEFLALPADINLNYGQAGFSLTWNATAIQFNSTGDGNYTIFRNGIPVETGTWNNGSSVGNNGTLIIYNIPTNLPVGNYTYVCEITNGYVGANVTDNAEVSVNNNLPKIAIPLTITAWHGTEGLSLSWNVTDDGSVTGTLAYTIFRSGVIVQTGVWTNATNFTYNIPALHPIGTYSYTVNITDGYHNVTSTGVAVTINTNDIPSVSTPGSFSQVFGTYGTKLSWTITDNSVDLDNAYTITRNGTIVATGQWVSGVPIEYEIHGLLWELGVYTYVLIASDGYDAIPSHNGTSGNTVVTIDANLKPAIVEPLPVVRGYGSGGPTLQWTITDSTLNDSRSYTIFQDGTPVITGTFWTSGSNVTYGIPADLWIGDHYFTIEVDDGYTKGIPGHNMTTSPGTLVTITNNPPYYGSEPNPVYIKVYETAGPTLNWQLIDDSINITARYTIYQNGTVVQTGIWNTNENISYPVPSSLTVGYYIYTVQINDGFPGNVTSNQVVVRVDNYIRFQVVDTLGGQTYSGIQVYFKHQTDPTADYWANTNATGNVTFTFVTPGLYNIEVNQTIGPTTYRMYTQTGFSVGAGDSKKYGILQISITHWMLQLKNATGGAVSNASVYIEEVGNQANNRILTTDDNGNVTFFNVDYDIQWNVVVQKWGFGDTWVLMNCTMGYTTNAFVYYSSYITNLTNAKFTVTDYDGAYIIGAEVKMRLNVAPFTTLSAITDASGVVYFRQIFNASWTLTVNASLFSGIYYIVKELPTYNPATALFYYSENLDNCNKTTIRINAVDKDVSDPQYWNLYNARIDIRNVTNNALLGTYNTNTLGNITVTVPRTVFNFSVFYIGLNKSFVVPNIDMVWQDYHIINIATYGRYYTFNVSVGIKKSSLEMDSVIFGQSGNWASNGGQAIQNLPGYYSITVFDDDSITMNFLYKDVSEFPYIGILDATGDCLVFRGATQISNPIISALGNGIYSVTVNTAAANFFTGTYVLTINLVNASYQEALFEVNIIILNHTAGIVRLDSNNQIYQNQGYSTQIRYAASYPEIMNLPGAGIYFDIIGTGFIHQSMTDNGAGVYTLTLPTESLTVGVYEIRIYGNLTNFDYASISFSLNVVPMSSKIGILISPEFLAGPNYLKTSDGENITFQINFTKGDGSLFADYLGLAKVRVFMDGSNVSNFIYYQGAGIYLFTMPATGYGGLVKQFLVNATYPQYETQLVTVQANIIQKWGSQLALVTSPSYYIWGQNVSFIVYYSCNEYPRAGFALNGATINAINITYYVGIVETSLLYLDGEEFGQGLWGYTPLGSGNYLVWFNSSVITISAQQQFIAKPVISVTNYKEASARGFFFVRPVTMDLVVMTAENPNVPVSVITVDQSNVTMILANLSIADSAYALNGAKINTATVTYRIYDYTNTLIEGPTALTWFTDGQYTFNLTATNIGYFRIVITAVLQNYTTDIYTFEMKVNLLPFTIGVEITGDVKIASTEMKVAHGENFTFIITINDGVENPYVFVYFDYGTPYEVDLSAFVYNSSSTVYVVTFSSGLTSIGDHSVFVRVTKELYNPAEINITAHIIEKWATRLRVVQPLEIYTWGQVAWFIVEYSITESPRNGWMITGATMSELQIHPTVNPSNLRTLQMATNGTNWAIIDLSQVGELAEFPGSGSFDDGMYLIWFRTDIVNVSSATDFNTIPALTKPSYSVANRISKALIQPLASSMITRAIDDRDGSLIPSLATVTYLEGTPITLQVIWNVSDPTSIFYLAPLSTGGTVSYSIIKLSNNQTIYSGVATPAGNGVYNITLVTDTSGKFVVQITGVMENYTSASISAIYNLGFDQVQFNAAADTSVQFGGPLSIKVSKIEQYLFYIDLMGVDVTELNVTILIDGLISVPYTEINKTYLRVNGTVANLTFGDHVISIIVDRINYIPKQIDIGLQVIQSWGTTLQVVQAPTLYPWSNNASFIVKYLVAEEPRKGQILESATISRLVLLRSLDNLGADLVYGDYSFNYESNERIWGYDYLGNGNYLIWLNTSYINIELLQSFYIIPYIEQANHAEAYATPYVWVDTVKTTLIPTLSVSSTGPVMSSVVLNNYTVQLDQWFVFYTIFGVTDSRSVLDGSFVNNAMMTYTIWDVDGDFPLTVGIIGFNQNGLYSVNITAFRIGNYRVIINGTKTNYQQQIVTFDLFVTPKTISYSVDSDVAKRIVESPRNRERTIIITVPVEGASVYAIFNGERLNFTKAEDSDEFSYTFTPALLAKFKENSFVNMTLYIEAVNCTTVVIPISFRVGFSVDKTFGIPYMYWLIIGFTVGTFVAIVVIRKAVYNANIPVELKRIELARKLISKGKSAPNKNIVLTAMDEHYRRYGLEWKMLQLDMKSALDALKLTQAGAGDEELDGLLNEVNEGFQRDTDVIDQLLAEARERSGKKGYVSLDGSKRPADGQKTEDFDLDDFLTSTIDDEEKENQQK
jgi:hypothetical protein